VATRYRILIAATVICASAATGFVAYHRASRAQPSVSQSAAGPTSQPGAPTSQPGAPTPQPGAPTPQADAPTTKAGARPIPTSLPNLTMADRNGVKHALSEWKGRPLLINFWATWCDPCRREIPLLKRLRHEHSADGVEVVGIAVDFRDAVDQYARAMHIDYPVLIGEQDGLDAIAGFGMDPVFPFTVFADRMGRIVTLKIGELHPDEAHLILAEMKALDQGRLELAAAREEIAKGMASLANERAKAGPDPSGQ